MERDETVVIVGKKSWNACVVKLYTLTWRRFIKRRLVGRRRQGTFLLLILWVCDALLKVLECLG